MSIWVVSFTASLFTTLLLVRFSNLHKKFSLDHDLNGVQKFHSVPVPRIGGLGLFVGLCAAFLISFLQSHLVGKFGLLLLICALPAFGFGCAEDLTKRIGVKTRLLATAASSLMAGYLLGGWLSSVQMPVIDGLMGYYPVFAILLTVFAVTGVANAFNIIDGFNGLSGMVGVLTLGGIAYVALQLNDYEIMTAALAMVGAILGFLFFNYPRGQIFLGDGGAYLVGFWVAELSVLLTVRHPSVSKWFPLLLCAYPIFETLFSIYRRLVIHRTNPGMPDSFHLHQMIYKRVVRRTVGSSDAGDLVIRNSLTSPYLWVLTATAVIPAVIFWDNVSALRACTLIFVFTYVWFYRQIALFKVPRWMIIR